MKALLTMVIMMGMGCAFLLGIYVGRETAGLSVPDAVVVLVKKKVADREGDSDAAQGGSGGSAGAVSGPAERAAKGESSARMAPGVSGGSGAPTAPAREKLVALKHVDGRAIQAELVSLRDGMLKIRREDGHVFEFSLTHLQAADQRLVREHFAGSVAADAAKTGETKTAPAAGGGGGKDPFTGLLDYMDYLNEAVK